MLKNLLKYIQEEHVAEQLYHSLIGIEIEEHRIDQHGQLSQLPYPKHLGSRRYHPYLQSDFSESMSELITILIPTLVGCWISLTPFKPFWPVQSTNQRHSGR